MFWEIVTYTCLLLAVTGAVCLCKPCVPYINTRLKGAGLFLVAGIAMQLVMPQTMKLEQYLRDCDNVIDSGNIDRAMRKGCFSERTLDLQAAAAAEITQ
jgi:hypothetical protein